MGTILQDIRYGIRSLRNHPAFTAIAVITLVVRQAMILALAGVGIGLLASWALTRLIKGLLFSVSVTDPMTFVGIALLMTFIALLACLIPARRATRVDPLVALRYE